MKVVREARAADDGFRSELVPGIRSSEDALRLAHELAFSAGRLLTLAGDPPGTYATARSAGAEDPEQACWVMFLTAYLCPDESGQPFAGIERALAGGEDPDLEGIELGPRTCHDPARGSRTLSAYREWAQRRGGAHSALSGDAGWTPERRFERALERSALPGFGRMGRYDMLVSLGRIGVLDVRAGSLHIAEAGSSGSEATTLAAKRAFGIADPILLERRAGALADGAGVPVEALDLALSNWQSPPRATMGVGEATPDEDVLAGARDALGV